MNWNESLILSLEVWTGSFRVLLTGFDRKLIVPFESRYRINIGMMSYHLVNFVSQSIGFILFSSVQRLKRSWSEKEIEMLHCFELVAEVIGLYIRISWLFVDYSGEHVEQRIFKGVCTIVNSECLIKIAPAQVQESSNFVQFRVQDFGCVPVFGCPSFKFGLLMWILELEKKPE